jgi:hypothetical protein
VQRNEQQAEQGTTAWRTLQKRRTDSTQRLRTRVQKKREHTRGQHAPAVGEHTGESAGENAKNLQKHVVVIMQEASNTRFKTVSKRRPHDSKKAPKRDMELPIDARAVYRSGC